MHAITVSKQSEQSTEILFPLAKLENACDYFSRNVFLEILCEVFQDNYFMKHLSEAYSEPSQTFKIKLFTKIVNNFQS